MSVIKSSIIVEGLDCTGKSTIIKHIQNEIPRLKYYHFEFPQGNTDIEKYAFQWGQFDMMFKFIELTNGSTQFIFDRAHIGEYIWGPKYRKMFPDYMPMIEDKYKNLPIVLLHVHAHHSKIYQRFEQREDEKTPGIMYIKEYLNKFRLFCERSPFYTISLNTTDLETPDQISAAVKDVVRQIDEFENK